MIHLLALLLAAGSVLANRNPIVISPGNSTVNAGDTIVIQWTNATTGFVNIDLEGMVLINPLVIALGVPATQKSYSWKVPEVLKTAVGYKVRVWGSAPPRPGEQQGVSEMFTVFNNIPKAINAFKVLSPNGEQPCFVNKKCDIKWDYLDSTGPAYVHLRLFEAGNPIPILHIADVPSSLKSYSWEIPADAPYMNRPGLYVSVSGAGSPIQGPGFANELGGNGGVFEVSGGAPAPVGQAGAKEDEFKAAQVEDVETDTVTVTTGTTTIKTTITESNAAAGMSSSGVTSQAFWFLVVPMLVLLF